MIKPYAQGKESGFSLTIGPFLLNFTYESGILGREEANILDHYADFLIGEPQTGQNAHSFRLYPGTPPADGLDARNMMVLDNELRHWAARQARQCHGFMCHSAGLVHHDKGWLLSGRSGAGKTTLALKLATHCQMVLTDEACIVLPVENGWKVWGTPFYGTGEQGVTGPGSPLQAIFFPHKAQTLGAKAINKEEALARMLQAVIVPDRNNDGTVLVDAISLIESCKTYQTWFAPHSTPEEVYHAIITALSS
jgi:hypothetical protein